MENKSLATAREVADYFHVPLRTIYQWNYLGTGPTPIKVGRHVRYRWTEVEKWLDEQSRDNAA
ncbi:helix-turn-helix domain-containing protein [Streptomyces sp. MB09-02B]|uniref:helix-turn-helix transcriptional regulator n=1 Tax=Streptomyces sp. MB09-02B TaxID=3028667 RepID=UPI0029AAFB4B|nr:helix-turn-helix domain-containing protein [Streptomyces sp. MB09-02B]MDX3641433.1 helix-turn-helix domain-containing protein [Streptomyces sp. MB09-02B]